MIEYLLDMYYPGGGSHRIKVRHSDWIAMKTFMNPNRETEEEITDYCWTFFDAAGAYVSVDFTKCSIVKLWARRVDNPLNTPEIYEDPLS